MCCVISSFITKPQPLWGHFALLCVALYPLSSPNHNLLSLRTPMLLVALYPLSSPNHNYNDEPYIYKGVALYPLSSPNHNYITLRMKRARLRYILFHHQTTTVPSCCFFGHCCVISSFITKPQRCFLTPLFEGVALYPLSSPNHNEWGSDKMTSHVALYPLSSPNHNSWQRQDAF